jgi:hypothetical protein
MNIFVTSPCPEQSAVVLPDRHITKMPLEACQMLAYAASPTYHNYGTLPKKDGDPYANKPNAHFKHPCTLWVVKSIHNASWLLYHGLMLCEEFERRYKHQHGCYNTLLQAFNIFPEGDYAKATPFVRAMPDELKNNKLIDTFTAYRKFLATKEWAKNNYLKVPSRKPSWI